MLTLLGFLTVIVIVLAIMTKKLHATIALIIVPIVTALIAGAGANIGAYITAGIVNIAPTGVMFIFAILFFAILSDAGTFDPIVNKILEIVGADPVKIAVGTVVLTCLVHLDGAGATTFLIAIPALLPLYKKVGMSPFTLATLVALSAGTMNTVPWGSVALRAFTVMESSVDEIFTPLIIPIIVGLLFITGLAIYLGKKEKKLLENAPVTQKLVVESDKQAIDEAKLKLQRPKLFILNISFILITIITLITAILPPAVVFMVATSIALIINYPDVKTQKERIDAHAKSALMMASTLFAAGSFVGIMQNSGMIDAMSATLISLLPESMGGFLAIIVGILGVPMSLFFDPDSYYFGIMPVIANTFYDFGGNPIMVARASLLGQMTLGFPVSPLTPSTFLLVGLAGIDIGEHQKKTFFFAWTTSLVMLAVAIIIGVITTA